MDHNTTTSERGEPGNPGAPVRLHNTTGEPQTNVGVPSAEPKAGDNYDGDLAAQRVVAGVTSKPERAQEVVSLLAAPQAARRDQVRMAMLQGLADHIERRDLDTMATYLVRHFRYRPLLGDAKAVGPCLHLEPTHAAQLRTIEEALASVQVTQRMNTTRYEEQVDTHMFWDQVRRAVESGTGTAVYTVAARLALIAKGAWPWLVCGRRTRLRVSCVRGNYITRLNRLSPQSAHTTVTYNEGEIERYHDLPPFVAREGHIGVMLWSLVVSPPQGALVYVTDGDPVGPYVLGEWLQPWESPDVRTLAVRFVLRMCQAMRANADFVLDTVHQASAHTGWGIDDTDSSERDEPVQDMGDGVSLEDWRDMASLQAWRDRACDPDFTRGLGAIDSAFFACEKEELVAELEEYCHEYEWQSVQRGDADRASDWTYVLPHRRDELSGLVWEPSEGGERISFSVGVSAPQSLDDNQAQHLMRSVWYWSRCARYWGWYRESACVEVESALPLPHVLSAAVRGALRYDDAGDAYLFPHPEAFLNGLNRCYVQGQLVMDRWFGSLGLSLSATSPGWRHQFGWQRAEDESMEQEKCNLLSTLSPCWIAAVGLQVTVGDGLQEAPHSLRACKARVLAEDDFGSSMAYQMYVPGAARLCPWGLDAFTMSWTGAEAPTLSIREIGELEDRYFWEVSEWSRTPMVKVSQTGSSASRYGSGPCSFRLRFPRLQETAVFPCAPFGVLARPLGDDAWPRPVVCEMWSSNYHSFHYAAFGVPASYLGGPGRPTAFMLTSVGVVECPPRAGRRRDDPVISAYMPSSLGKCLRQVSL
uniref:Capsid protein n=1 Tax=Keenan toti-like virus TaxID=2716731 RepID=A0A6G7PS95_9VIRU|nr:capsid protein [Keenan toti-like virus]